MRNRTRQPELRDGLRGIYNVLWSQAAAQGLTISTAAGEPDLLDVNVEYAASASEGLAVNGVASPPYATAVGATDFYYGRSEAATQNTYNQCWGQSTTAFATALGHIPEQP